MGIVALLGAGAAAEGQAWGGAGAAAAGVRPLPGAVGLQRALWVGAGDPRRGASAVTVTDIAQLNSALAAAQGGDTIRLAPGAYSGLRANGLNYAREVTITSADALHPAVLSPFYMRNSSNISFNNMEFSASESTDPHPLRTYNSNDISFSHDSFYGDRGATPSSSPSDGVAFFSCASVRVIASDFTHLKNGIDVMGADGGVFSNNSFHQMRSDGIDTSAASDVLIENNVFTDFYPAVGDHPDAIQFWTSGTTTPSHDVVIDGNLVVRNSGAPIQGVFLADEIGTLRYQNVTISNNLIIGGMYNGIAVFGATNTSILSNVVAPYPDMNSWIRMVDVDGLIEKNNLSHTYLFTNDAKVVQSANAWNNFVFDRGRILTAKWRGAHPGWTGTLPAALSDLIGAGSHSHAEFRAFVRDDG
jgi:hypothetical protein